MGAAYDLERIIDDWILMGFLVGNDFIPHLPNLHINHNALPLLYKNYISVLPSIGGELQMHIFILMAVKMLHTSAVSEQCYFLTGYLNENGNLNLRNFEKYLEKLSEVRHFFLKAVGES